MLRLLQDIATDVSEAVGPDNPLRQVIINTHSPSVVLQVPEDSLVVAELKEAIGPRGRFKRACFNGLDGTWQQDASGRPGVPLGVLIAYLNPDDPERLAPEFGELADKSRPRRVIDRTDLQLLLPSPAHE
jgi:hypothetical protein